MKNVDQNFTITFQTVMIWYFLLWLSPEFSKDNVAKVKLGCGLGSMVRNSLFGFFNIQTYCIQVENWSCIILNGTFEYLSLLNWYSLNLYSTVYILFLPLYLCTCIDIVQCFTYYSVFFLHPKSVKCFIITAAAAIYHSHSTSCVGLFHNFQILLSVILMLSGSVGVQTFPLMIGNMTCGVLIWIINSREKWKVCSPFW